MDNVKSVSMPLEAHFKVSLKDCPSNDWDVERISEVPYANAVGSLMYLMVCTRPDIAYVVSIVSMYLANPGKNHWEAVKWILKYLKGTANVGLVYGRDQGKHMDVDGFVDAYYAKDTNKGRSIIGEIVESKEIEVAKIGTKDNAADAFTKVVPGAEADGFSSVHRGFEYRVRNEEGRTILEFAAAHDLVVVNSFFKKRDAHLITYHSGHHDTQIDYMLVRRGDLRVCKDCKVFLSEVCFSQHRLLALDINIKRRPRLMKMAVKPRILWKNLHGEAAEAFRTRVTEGVTPELGGRTTTDAEQMWNRLANTIREAAKETLGVVARDLRTHIGRRESWWFSKENKVKAKQTRFRKLISMRGNKADRSATEERYKEAKREEKKAVARAKDKAYEDLYKRLDSKEGENNIYRIAKARQRRKMDLGRVRFIKDEDGRSIVNEDAIRRRWKEYFSALFNGQRRGRTEDVDSIGAILQNNCYRSRIIHAEVKEALRKMGRNKAVGPDEIPIEA
ncbi:retrovirus-related pol polyprotein LINE-1 [Tanacetum coccineum]